MEHPALLTWACRSTLLLAASTSGCGAGEGWRTLYRSASAWYRTGRNPWERSKLSLRSGVGLDTEETTCELPDCYEEQGEDFSVQLCPLCSEDFASACFPKEHLHLETENLNSYAIIKLNADKLSEFRQALHTHATLARCAWTTLLSMSSSLARMGWGYKEKNHQDDRANTFLAHHVLLRWFPLTASPHSHGSGSHSTGEKEWGKPWKTCPRASVNQWQNPGQR